VGANVESRSLHAPFPARPAFERAASAFTVIAYLPFGSPGCLRGLPRVGFGFGSVVVVVIGFDFGWCGDRTRTGLVSLLLLHRMLSCILDIRCQID